MKAAGYSASEVTTFYSKVREALAQNKFEQFAQLSIYTSSQPNTLTNAFGACQALSAIPDTDKFIKRLHLFRVEDFNDLLPLIAKGKRSSDTDATEEKIREVFGADTGKGTDGAASRKGGAKLPAAKSTLQ
jgi:virulence-associated protein VapD